MLSEFTTSKAECLYPILQAPSYEGKPSKGFSAEGIYCFEFWKLFHLLFTNFREIFNEGINLALKSVYVIWCY